jgi:BirA family biotin operon repressor/biotin-[acetyl-CoA-carboxylase] ligase
VGKLFNIEVFDIKLNTDFIGRNFIYVEEIDSTNSYLLNKSNKVKADGTVILAEKQNRGRGRKDRSWYSNKGQNLTLSILLADKRYFGKSLNTINFAVSLAVAEAIENMFQLRTELKWPNDVLVNKRKIAGILFESISAGSKIERLVAGIGLNVNQTLFQGQFSIEPTSIKLEFGESVERERLLADILNIFEELLQQSLLNPAVTMNDWKLRCRMIGEKISIAEGNESRYGIFEDIDDDGFLLLKSKKGIERIHYGDVSLR